MASSAYPDMSRIFIEGHRFFRRAASSGPLSAGRRPDFGSCEALASLKILGGAKAPRLPQLHSLGSAEAPWRTSRAETMKMTSSATLVA
jgi:hypothetical protein